MIIIKGLAITQGGIYLKDHYLLSSYFAKSTMISGTWPWASALGGSVWELDSLVQESRRLL